jgi:CubicO group peptidase (beta-lactamase class C family)
MVLAVLLCSYHAQIRAQQLHNSNIATEFRQFLTTKLKESNYVGVAAGLIVDGQVVLREGFGYADKRKGIPMTPHTQVGIGSVTKTFTALAAMQLWKQKVVDIDKPVSTYLPQFDIKTHGEDLSQVTLRALITHTSGVPTDVYKDQDFAHGNYTHVVELLNQTAMAHPPGVVGLYSNAGYNVLAHALALASGIDYPTYVERRIFAPLAMKNSSFGFDQGGHRRSKSYAPEGTEAFPPELRDIASGGIYSTVDDLIRYGKALMDAYNGKRVNVISSRSIRSMWTLSNAAIPIETNKKGLGWFLFKNDSMFAAYHSGSTFYANAALLLIPQRNAAAVILVNTADGHEIAEQFAFRFLEKYGMSVKDIVPTSITTPSSTSNPTGQIIPISVDTGFYARKYDYAKVSLGSGGLLIEHDGKATLVERKSTGEFVQKGKPNGTATDSYNFKDIGPYHVLFQRHGNREQQLGYRVPQQHLDSVWMRRLGHYQLFGYSLLGFEKLTDAEIYTQEDGMLLLSLTYNTGTFTYPLVDLAQKEAKTGGLGPENTGVMVYFSGDPDSEVLTYLGLTFKRDCTGPAAH